VRSGSWLVGNVQSSLMGQFESTTGGQIGGGRGRAAALVVVVVVAAASVCGA
jgi:hypothetical protein